MRLEKPGSKLVLVLALLAAIGGGVALWGEYQRHQPDLLQRAQTLTCIAGLHARRSFWVSPYELGYMDVTWTSHSEKTASGSYVVGQSMHDHLVDIRTGKDVIIRRTLFQNTSHQQTVLESNPIQVRRSDVADATREARWLEGLRMAAVLAQRGHPFQGSVKPWPTHLPDWKQIPQDADILAVSISPDDKQLLWLLWYDTPSLYETLLQRFLGRHLLPHGTLALNISDRDGGHMREIGHHHAGGYPCAYGMHSPNEFALDWVPDGRRVSFVFREKLYLLTLK